MKIVEEAQMITPERKFIVEISSLNAIYINKNAIIQNNKFKELKII